jgi:hypothetical protein
MTEIMRQPSKAKKKLVRELAEFLDDRIIRYANEFQGKEPPPPCFETAPGWYKKTLLSVAHDVREHERQRVFAIMDSITYDKKQYTVMETTWNLLLERLKKLI